jgi:hypothetical protein
MEFINTTKVPTMAEFAEKIYGLRPGLPLHSEITLDKFAGPLDESNLVFDRFYAGAFPGDYDDKTNDDTLIKLLNIGVTRFVCMRKEYQDSIRANWKYLRIRPYFRDVQRIVSNREKYPLLNPTVPNDIKFDHFPIEDLKTTTDEKTLEAAKTVVAALENGETVYLHCWGGHGRTGIIVCLVLHLMYDLTATDAINYCELVHSMRRSRLDVSSPQTDVQRQQVHRIIKLLNPLPLPFDEIK